MPTVDFTLADIKDLIDNRLDTRLDIRFKAEREHTQAMITSAFEKEREHTRSMIQAGAEDIKQSIAGEFVNFWEHNLGPVLDDLNDSLARVASRVGGLEGDPKEMKRDLKSVTT